MSIIWAMNSAAQNSANEEPFDLAALQQPLSVGPVVLKNRVFLAPMSGVTDLPFRNLANNGGAGLVVSEMVASQEFVKGSPESQLRSERGNADVHMVQLAGREAYWMAEAARKLEANGADIIDINMGCPAKKVTGGYSGSALMRDLDHAMTLIDATVKSVSIPVTLKMRLGWDESAINAPELGWRAQNAGVQMITVHGRTRCQFYKGAADWEAVRAVKAAISVPLVVNGDITSRAAALAALKQSGADAIMAGRAHYGQPWFSGQLLGAPSFGTPDDLIDYVVAHYESMLGHYGKDVGLRHARKHLASYLERHAPETSNAVKSAILQSTDTQAVISHLRLAFQVQSSSCKELAA